MSYRVLLAKQENCYIFIQRKIFINKKLNLHWSIAKWEGGIYPHPIPMTSNRSNRKTMFRNLNKIMTKLSFSFIFFYVNIDDRQLKFVYRSVYLCEFGVTYTVTSNWGVPCALKFRREFIAHITCLRLAGTNFCKIVDSTILDKTRALAIF